MSRFGNANVDVPNSGDRDAWRGIFFPIIPKCHEQLFGAILTWSTYLRSNRNQFCWVQVTSRNRAKSAPLRRKSVSGRSVKQWENSGEVFRIVKVFPFPRSANGQLQENGQLSRTLVCTSLGGVFFTGLPSNPSQ